MEQQSCEVQLQSNDDLDQKLYIAQSQGKKGLPGLSATYKCSREAGEHIDPLGSHHVVQYVIKTSLALSLCGNEIVWVYVI